LLKIQAEAITHPRPTRVERRRGRSLRGEEAKKKPAATVIRLPKIIPGFVKRA
jgi:hypothetical protein